MDYAHTGENHTGENLPAQAPQAGPDDQERGAEGASTRGGDAQQQGSTTTGTCSATDGLDAACSYVYKYMLKGGSSATRISCQP